MITVNDIPLAWREFLAAIQKTHPEALIAGGCLRDLDNGKPVKDVDIFIHSSEGGFAEDVCNTLDKAFPTNFDFDNPVIDNPAHLVHMTYGGWGTECAGYCEVHKGGVVYQIIGLTNPVSMRYAVTRMDFGICQIASDGRTVWFTPMYLHDKSNSTFTLLRADDEKDTKRSLKRFSRLSKKYVGWPLVFPS